MVVPLGVRGRGVLAVLRSVAAADNDSRLKP